MNIITKIDGRYAVDDYQREIVHRKKTMILRWMHTKLEIARNRQIHLNDMGNLRVVYLISILLYSNKQRKFTKKKWKKDFLRKIIYLDKRKRMLDQNETKTK